MDYDGRHESQINHFLSNLLLLMIFITARESKLLFIFAFISNKKTHICNANFNILKVFLLNVGSSILKERSKNEQGHLHVF